MAKEKKIEPKKNLEQIMAAMQKKYEDAAIISWGDWKLDDAGVIPTGAVTLDKAIGIGGIPRGRLTVVYGRESSGKTTLAIHIMVQAQKMGLKTVMVDAEAAFDLKYAEAIGVDLKSLIVIRPSYGEMAFEMIQPLVDSGEVGLVVVDSIARLVPQKEIEEGRAEIGGIARLMSAGLRRILPAVKKYNVALFFINQVRDKIGVMYGNPETLPGGNAQLFDTSLIMRISKAGLLGDDKDNPDGIHTKVKITKSKVAPPLRTAEFDIYYGTGIDNLGCIVDLAASTGIIQKQSSYYTVAGKKYAGREKAIEALRADPATFDEIYKQVMASEAETHAEVSGKDTDGSADVDAEISD